MACREASEADLRRDEPFWPLFGAYSFDRTRASALEVIPRTSRNGFSRVILVVITTGTVFSRVITAHAP